jgi:uncharacterized membrane protein YbhN (UPF0104 family)
MKKRQVAFLIAKIAFAAVVISWLFHKIDLARIWSHVREARAAPIFVGIALSMSTIVIAGWRWQRLLRIFGIAVPLKSLVCIVPIGAFFTTFLPGSTGDDLTRMLYISRLAPGRIGEACISVVLDRIIGLSAVLLLALSCVPWQWSVLSTSRETFWIAVAILGAAGVACMGGALFFLAGHPTHRWFVKRLRSHPPHSLRDEAARIWGLLCDNKTTVAKLVGAALLAQFIQCVAFFLAGVSVGIHQSLQIWLTFLPIVLAANVLPITIAGLGVREYLLVLFLGVVAGVDNARAFAASFVMFAMIFTICLLGGLLYIFYKPKSAETVQA